MKSFIVFSTLFITLSAQAVSYKCFSIEENVGGPEYSISIGAARRTGDGMGNTFMRNPVRITRMSESGVLYFDGTGTATSRKLDLNLLQGGDMMMGEIVAKKENVAGRLSGYIRMVADGGAIETAIDCIVGR